MIVFFSKYFSFKLSFAILVLSAVVYYLPIKVIISEIFQEMTDQSPAKASNIYGFKVKDLDGNEVDMEKYRGKVLIIVNTASNCGLTKNNISKLNQLFDKYKDKPFQILGFPSNTFKQEYSCDTDIKEFVSKNNIEWDYFSKITVNGDETEPLFQYLKANTSGFLTKAIKWNFTKFLINKEGVVVSRFAPTDSPLKIEGDIEKLLSA